jgi:hypothetical protein
LDLAKSIPPKAILVQLPFKEAFATKNFSHMVMARWFERVEEAMNFSALNLLTERLDSRIDWKKSIADKVSNVEV